MRLPFGSDVFSKFFQNYLSRLAQIAAVFEISVTELLTLNDANFNQWPNKLNVLHEKLFARETEVIDLQKKVIELFEELRNSKPLV
ncbi:hypothetical protein [Mucilaginibacter rubeus]|jgi:hypothetical protein|uniref:hypothetical protein n=1 Tax=Mucilaginibacter rubeus TaxID=2027860 RepID=UPI001663B32D|nr:hypothetical protein [Mucilaginibacter rubeus]GGA96425.1 hypothetical protein GCM10011500_10310 [Mucilaginibacter rubeus]